MIPVAPEGVACFPDTAVLSGHIVKAGYAFYYFPLHHQGLKGGMFTTIVTVEPLVTIVPTPGFVLSTMPSGCVSSH